MRPDYANIKRLEIELGFREPDPPVLTPTQRFHQGLLDEFTEEHYDYRTGATHVLTRRRMPDGQIAAVHSWKLGER